MRKPQFVLSLMIILLVGITLVGSGCKKVVQPAPVVPKAEPPTPAPPAPAPTLSLSASPSTIEQGQSATLSWNSTNATSVSIDGGIGTVEPSGSRTVSPSASTTFKAKAAGAGGSATAEARITVTTPPPVIPPPVRRVSDSEFFTENIKDINFDFDKYDIREDARTILMGDARALGDRNSIRFIIEGHCDERGSEKYNMALGDRRANATKEFLVSQGLSADRAETISYGIEKPVCSEHSEECWQNNRRAHFVLK